MVSVGFFETFSASAIGNVTSNSAATSTAHILARTAIAAEVVGKAVSEELHDKQVSRSYPEMLSRGGGPLTSVNSHDSEKRVLEKSSVVVRSQTTEKAEVTWSRYIAGEGINWTP